MGGGKKYGACFQKIGCGRIHINAGSTISTSEVSSHEGLPATSQWEGLPAHRQTRAPRVGLWTSPTTQSPTPAQWEGLPAHRQTRAPRVGLWTSPTTQSPTPAQWEGLPAHRQTRAPRVGLWTSPTTQSPTFAREVQPPHLKVHLIIHPFTGNRTGKNPFQLNATTTTPLVCLDPVVYKENTMWVFILLQVPVTSPWGQPAAHTVPTVCMEGPPTAFSCLRAGGLRQALQLTQVFNLMPLLPPDHLGDISSH
ncbi:F2 [Felid gammaherpesvirus 1]|uniref:F2 n=1 Tax=Felid gammaherpesvirus 1 TaxID=2560468 RepID=A0A0M4MS25_9GAMA|nr:F2 [Felis catus gammaherpesvirus 1]ALE14708.1 F2 [Felis catus gammaherpesvirus 1]